MTTDEERREEAKETAYALLNLLMRRRASRKLIAKVEAIFVEDGVIEPLDCNGLRARDP